MCNKNRFFSFFQNSFLLRSCPDITFFIDVTADEGHKRLNSKHPDRIEGAGKIFQEKVREQYLKLAQIYSDRFIVLDGEKTPEEIHQTIWLEINKIKKNEKKKKKY